MSSSSKKIGLFFGSFNPIHQGHIMIASYLLEYTDLYEIWFIISPHNPLKPKETLLDDHHRLALAKIAIEDYPRMKASDIEFNLPQPSYTCNTLIYLKEKYPTKDFVLIMGYDSLSTLNKWKNYEFLLDAYFIYAYPRPYSDGGIFKSHPHVKLVDAPLIEISSSFIRKSIKEKKNIEAFLPTKVYKYIQEMHFYK